MEQKEKIIKTYQDKEGAEKFDEKRSSTYGQRWHNDYERDLVIDSIKNSKNENLKILDVACGTGRFVNYLFKTDKSIEYHGIDTSDELLKQLKRKTGENKKVNIYCDDASKLPFKDETFDIVYSFHLLWHLKKEEQIPIIKEIIRVTKKKGIIILDVYNKNFIYDKIIRKKPAPGKEVFKLSIKEMKEILSYLRKIEIFGILDPHINNKIMFHFLTFIPNKILKRFHFLHHMLYFKGVK